MKNRIRKRVQRLDPWNYFGTYGREMTRKDILLPKVPLIIDFVEKLIVLILKITKRKYWVDRAATTNSRYIYIMKSAGKGIKIRLSDHLK